MRLSGIALVVVVVVVLSVGFGTVLAHGNEVVVGDQVTANGTVVVEHVTHFEPAHLVARRATGDGPGAVVGHRYLDVGGTIGTHDLLRLSVDDAATNGSERLWFVLHLDDGDGEFNRTDDPLIEQSGSPVGRRATVEWGPAPVSVVASDQTTDDEVRVRRVALATTGYVVLHAGSGSGDVVGRTALDSGVHRNVSVTLDGYHYNDADDPIRLTAVVHRDDGDGTFDRSTDEPVRAGELPVASTFSVNKSTATVSVTPTPTPTPTPSPTPTPTPSPTPTPTPSPTPTPTSMSTPTATPTPSPTPTLTPSSAGSAPTPASAPTAATPPRTQIPTATSQSSGSTDERAADRGGNATATGTSAASGPGLGFLGTLVALLVVVLAVRRRR